MTNRLILCGSTVAVLLGAASFAAAWPPIPDCWRENCINSSVCTKTLCYACCTANCFSSSNECMDWCNVRTYPSCDGGGGTW